MAWVAPAIGAVASIAGDLMSRSGQQSTNAMNIAMMRENQQWQEDMSNTAMQRRVVDLRKAGLNPMLAVGGPGAQMGSPVMPQIQNPDAPLGNLGGQVSGAVQLAQQGAAIEQMKASAEKSSADAAVQRAGLPYTGATAQAALDNLRRTNDNLTFTALGLERDYELSQRTLPQLMEDKRFAAQFKDLQYQMQAVDVQRQQLGLPRLANDATWQKAHPDISGWMQSGVPQGALDTVSTAAKAVGQFTPSTIVNKTFSFGRR